MNRIDIVIPRRIKALGNKTYKANHPDTWEELTPKQLIIAVAILNGQISDHRVILLMTDLPKRVINQLDPYQKLRIIELLKFLNDYKPYHEFIIPSIGRMSCPKPRLKDETFGTFIFAETYFLKYEKTYDQADLDKFIACLYRDAEFDTDTLEANAEKISKAKEDVRQAIYVNYILIRQYLAENYPYVFTPNDDPDTKETSNWVDVFDALVKDDIVKQQEYSDLPISTVLRYLDKQIKKARDER